MCVPTSTSSWSILYDEAGDEEKPNGGVDGDGKNRHKEEEEEERNWMKQIGGRLGAELEKYIHPLNEQHPATAKWHQTQ